MTCKNKEEKLEHMHTVKLQITMQGRTFLKTDCTRLRKGRHTDMFMLTLKERKQGKKERKKPKEGQGIGDRQKS